MKSFSFLLGLAGVGGMIAVAGCSKTPGPDPAVLAQVGDRVIRTADVEQEITWRRAARRAVPEPSVLLDEMINHELLAQRARAAGLEQDPEFQRAARSLLVSRFKERDVKPRGEGVQVSPEELRAACEQEQARLTQPAKARLALIQIKIDSKASEARRSELRTRLDEARASALALPKGEPGFGAVAAGYSEDQASRYKGGDVGWFDEGQNHYRWPAAVVAAGFGLAGPGAVSDVIAAEDGIYLVKKLDTRPAVVPPAGQFEDRVRQKLLARKRTEAEQEYFSEARRAAGVQTFPDGLSALPVKAANLAGRASGEPPSLP